MFCKVNILLFSSLLNMITASVNRWVGGSVGKWLVVDWSVVGGSVVGGFNKTPSEEEIVMYSDKMKAKCIKEDV